MESLFFLMIDLDGWTSDPALKAEWDRRISRSLLSAFEKLQADHPNVRLHPGLKERLRRRSGHPDG